MSFTVKRKLFFGDGCRDWGRNANMLPFFRFHADLDKVDWSTLYNTLHGTYDTIPCCKPSLQ